VSIADIHLRDKGLEFFVVEVQVGHLPGPLRHRRRVFKPGGHRLFPGLGAGERHDPLLPPGVEPGPGEVGGVVGPVPQDLVALHAVSRLERHLALVDQGVGLLLAPGLAEEPGFLAHRGDLPALFAVPDQVDLVVDHGPVGDVAGAGADLAGGVEGEPEQDEGHDQGAHDGGVPPKGRRKPAGAPREDQRDHGRDEDRCDRNLNPAVVHTALLSSGKKHEGEIRTGAMTPVMGRMSLAVRGAAI